MRGERLKALRAERGLTQEEFSELVDIAVRQLSRYETNQSDPTSEVIARMADVLSVSVDYLLGRTEDRASYVQLDNLTVNEKQALIEWRRGNKYRAIEIIVADEKASV